MAGTKAGAAKAVAKILADNPNHFRDIGAKGGSAKVPKGFAKIDRRIHEAASSKGGKLGKRGPAKTEEQLDAEASIAQPVRKRRWTELVFGSAYKKQYRKKDV